MSENQEAELVVETQSKEPISRRRKPKKLSNELVENIAIPNERKRKLNENSSPVYEELLDSLEEENNELRVKLKKVPQLETENEKLLKANKEKDKIIASLQQKLNDASMKIPNNNITKKRGRPPKAQPNVEINTLEYQNKTLLKENQLLRIKLTDKQSEIEKLKTDKEFYTEENTSLIDTTKKQFELIEELRGERNQLQLELQNTTSELKKAEEKICDLEAKAESNQEVELIIKELTDRKDGLEKNIEQLNRQVDDLAHQNSLLKNQQNRIEVDSASVAMRASTDKSPKLISCAPTVKLFFSSLISQPIAGAEINETPVKKI